VVVTRRRVVSVEEEEEEEAAGLGVAVEESERVGKICAANAAVVTNAAGPPKRGAAGTEHRLCSLGYSTPADAKG
jgi:hypothetical protein